MLPGPATVLTTTCGMAGYFGEGLAGKADRSNRVDLDPVEDASGET